MKNIWRFAFASLLAFELVHFFSRGMITPEFTWFGLIFTLSVVWIGLEAIDVFLFTKYQKRLPWFVWFSVFILISFDAFGDMFHLYGRWIWYDQVGHMAGTAVAMIVIVEIVKRVTGKKILANTALLAAYGLAITAGTLYEIEEYLEDVFLMSNRLGDGPDTANDLLMNLIGATVVFGFFYVQRKRDSKKRGR